MTAFLAHEMDPSLDPANLQDFGEVVSLLGKRRPSIYNPEAVIEAYHEALERYSYDPTKDVIVLSGRSVYIALLMRALKVHRRIIAVMYDAPTCRYVQVTI